jgi:hypothetical protein
MYYYINNWDETLAYFMPHSQVAWHLGLAIAFRSIATCLPLLLLLVFLLLMLMPMLMMLALTPMLLLYAIDVVAYADADDANADAKMPNDARHLASACVVVMMPTLLQLLRRLILVMMQC